MDRQETETPADPLPAYMRVQQDVLHRIRAGALVPGDRIPAERVLSEHTAAHRAIQFEQIISRCSGNSVPTTEATRTETKDTDPAVPQKAVRAGVCP